MSARYLVAGWALVAAISGCALSGPIPQARVRRGASAGLAPPMRVFATASECTAIEHDLCARGPQVALANIARMGLEYAGFVVIDPERVHPRTGDRVERTWRSAAGSSQAVEIDGAAWDDASAAEKRRLLGELEVSGLLLSRVHLGPSKNIEDQRTLLVELTLMRYPGRELVWNSKCGVDTGRFRTLEQALELATRCALTGALKVRV